MPPNTNFTQRFCPQNIPLEASKLRNDKSQLPAIESEFHGGHCRVYKLCLSSPTQETWAMRIPIYNRFSSEAPLISSLDQERSIVQSVQILNWVPRLIGSSLVFENSIGYPYLLVGWTSGTPLRWTESIPPRDGRDKILTQLALIQEELVEHTKTDGEPASDYMLRLVNFKFDRIRNGLLPGLAEEDCTDQKTRLQDIVIPQIDSVGFAIDHNDLKAANIIIDEKHNIVGIIDWGIAALKPALLAARLPCLLQLREATDLPSPTLKSDREVYLAALGTSSCEAAAWMRLVQAAPDVDARHFMMEAIGNRGMFKTLVDMKWEIPACGKVDLDMVENS